MTLFAAGIPALDHQVAGDIAHYRRDPLAPRVVTAAVVRLLERGLLRVGNDRYARDNHTYGLTTLRRSHVETSGPTITFHFVGKEHRPHTVKVHDQVTAEVVGALVRAAADDAQPIFTASGEQGAHHVTSAAVNAYLHAHTQSPASAKVFRTWGPRWRQLLCLLEPNPRGGLGQVAGTTRRGSCGDPARRHGHRHSVFLYPPCLDRRRPFRNGGGCRRRVLGTRRHHCRDQPFYRSGPPGGGAYRNHQCDIGGGARRRLGASSPFLAAGEGRVTGMLAEWDGLDAEPGGQRQRLEDRAQPD